MYPFHCLFRHDATKYRRYNKQKKVKSDRRNTGYDRIVLSYLVRVFGKISFLDKIGVNKILDSSHDAIQLSVFEPDRLFSSKKLGQKYFFKLLKRWISYKPSDSEGKLKIIFFLFNYLHITTAGKINYK